MKKLAIFILSAIVFNCNPFDVIAQVTLGGGDYHSLFLCTDGTVKSCGSNLYGMLGDSTTGTDRHSPVFVNGLTDIVAISSGGFHSLFLKSDGTVWASGDNSYGQLGDSTVASSSFPIQVPSLSGIIAIAAGETFSVFLKNDSTVWNCGRNNGGQLGDGTTDDKHAPSQIPTLTGIKGVAAGNYHSLFLQGNGTVRACGQNYRGQLGSGNNYDHLYPVPVVNITNVTAIAAGWEHSLFLRNDSTVWACGNNFFGQLGDGTFMLRNAPVQANSLSAIVAMDAGGDHSVFVKGDGTAWACGKNSSGELGIGTITNMNIAAQVVGLTGINNAAAGGSHSLFSINDSTVWSCGDNASGQLGDSTTTIRTTPVQVIDLCSVGNAVAPCSGIPNPGNTFSSGDVSTCPGVLFTLSLENATPGWGVSYIWQSSTLGTFTGTGGDVLTNLGTRTTEEDSLAFAGMSLYYRCMVICGMDTGISTPILITDVNCITLTMQNGSDTICSAMFYDSGGMDSLISCVATVIDGDSGAYQNNESYIYTIYPSAGNVIRAAFNYFCTKYHDGLIIYNGPDTTYPKISSGLPREFFGSVNTPSGSYYGNYGAFTATSTVGPLTFRFRTNPNTTSRGWEATISCVSGVCSGVPVPGMILDPGTTCMGDTLLLTLFDAEIGISIDYQWQKDTGSGFTNFGTGGYSQSDVITGNTSYRCIVSCSSNSNSSTTLPITVNVVTPPSGGPISGPSAGCANVVLDTITTSGGNGSYQWSVKVNTNPYFDIIGSNTATLTGYVPTVGGTYRFRCRRMNAPCEDAYSDTLVVIITPTVTASATPSSICPGDTVFLAGGGDLDSATYFWSANPAGYIADSTMSSTTANPVATTVYTFSVTRNGCTNTATRTVIVHPAPTATAQVVNEPYCNGQSTGSVTTLVSGGSGPYTYLWSPGGNTTATASGIPAGCYTVNVNDANGCSASDEVCIIEPSAVTLTLTVTDATCSTCNDGSILANASGGLGGYTYTWIPNGPNNLTPGIYTVCVTDANGCSTCSIDTVSSPVSVPFISATTGYSVVHPNPFTEKTTISFSVPTAGRAVIKVYDAVGRQVETLFDAVASPGKIYKVVFYGTHSSGGIYYYSITSDKINETKRIELVK
jgi:alpha-tubulin suppressor-like RCC1 family protein